MLKNIVFVQITAKINYTNEQIGISVFQIPDPMVNNPIDFLMNCPHMEIYLDRPIN